MEQKHKDLLLTNRTELKIAVHLSISDVANRLLSMRIISPDMKESVLSGEIQGEKAFKLLDLLPTRGKKAFKAFYDAVCYYQLWDAADILEPDNAPHERNDVIPAGGNFPHGALPCGPPNYGQFPGPGFNGMQLGYSQLSQTYKAIEYYKQEMRQDLAPSHQRNGNFPYSQYAIHESQGYIYQYQPMGQNYHHAQQGIQYLCLRDPNEEVSMDSSPTDSPEDILTKCQCRISECKVPLNINDYIILAALERKADLEDRKANDIVSRMASKAKEYFEAKINELTSDNRMTPEKAIRKYISLSQPQNSQTYSGCRFFQVWGLSPPALLGPNILAINRQEIGILDIATKKPKVDFWKPLTSLEECRTSRDNIFSVILKFQDHDMFTLLSLEFEEICQELDTLIDQNTTRYRI